MMRRDPDATRFPLGVSLHTLDREQRLDTIETLGGSPVKSVELWEPTFGKDEGHVREARRALAKAGVEPRTVHAAFGTSVDISSLDPAIRSAGIQTVGVALDLAVRMGARMVVVHPSSEPIGSDARDERIKQSKRSIETIAGMVHEAGCRMAVELLPRTCLGRSAAELLELLEGVDPGTAGVCLDTNHLMDRFGSLPEVVRSLGPRLFTLHCSDYDGVDEQHWPPLRGVIDWAAFLAALGAACFSGPFHDEAALDGQTPAERLAFLEASYSQLMETPPRRGEAEHRAAGDAVPPAC
jgi:sugar phosphate isomerase/epimerase